MLEHVLDNFRCWRNPEIEYQIETGEGKYFCSALNTFLKSNENIFNVVVFPDVGALKRFSEMVLAPANKREKDVKIFWTNKERKGEQVKLTGALYNIPPKNFIGDLEDLLVIGDKPITSTDNILIIDDFTNSGSSLFGCKDLIIAKGSDNNFLFISGNDKPNISCWVSHYVAKYHGFDNGKDLVERLVNKVSRKGIDNFYVTDTLPYITSVLAKKAKEAGVLHKAPGYVDIPEVVDGKGKLHILSCGKSIADWINKPFLDVSPQEREIFRQYLLINNTKYGIDNPELSAAAGGSRSRKNTYRGGSRGTRSKLPLTNKSRKSGLKLIRVKSNKK